MKLTLLFLLVSVCAFAQQKYKPVQKPVKEDLYYDSGNGQKINLSDYDSLDIDFKKELYDLTRCICPLYMFPDAGKEWRPRELHPYQWKDDKPLVIFLDSADLKDFKGVQFFIDTTRTKKAPAIF